MFLTAAPHQHASRNVDDMPRERDVSEVQEDNGEEAESVMHPITLTTPCEMRCNCVSCGDVINEPQPDDPPDVIDQMRARCRLCAMEVLGIKTPNFGAFQQHDTGGGWRVIRETKTH